MTKNSFVAEVTFNEAIRKNQQPNQSCLAPDLLCTVEVMSKNYFIFYGLLLLLHFENISADAKTKTETRPQLGHGLNCTMKPCRILALTCVYFDILELTTSVPIVF